jgi:DHA2 family multidrug resistance protein
LSQYVGFTVASMLCGLPGTLRQWCCFRVMQGRLWRSHRAAGADIPARHQSARTPRPGDGYLWRRHHGRADHRADPRRLADRSDDWRWCSLSTCRSVSSPFLALPPICPRLPSGLRGFDFFGFAMLSLGVGALQLMLDRGAEVTGFRQLRSGLNSASRSSASGCLSSTR